MSPIDSRHAATEGDAVPVPGDVTVLSAEQDKRTYAVPRSALDSAEQGLRWYREHKRGADTALAAAALLTVGAPLRMDAVAAVASAVPALGLAMTASGSGWSPDDPGFPSAERINHALAGGDAGQRWARRIVRRASAQAALAAAAEQAQSVIAETTKDAVIEDVTGLGDGEGFTEYEAQIESMRQQPYAPHPYIPPLGADGGGIDEPCEVCGAHEPALVHTMDEILDEDATAPAGDGTERARDALVAATVTPGADLAQRTYAVGSAPEILLRRALTAMNFYLPGERSHREPGLDLGTEYFVALTAGGSITRVYAEDVPGRRRRWDSRAAQWDDVLDADADADAVIAVDPGSAYGAAMLLGVSDGDPAPLQDVDPVEWAIAQEAAPMLDVPTVEPYPPGFCVDEMEDESSPTVYVSTGVPGALKFWLWDPSHMQFVESLRTPRSCVQVDEDEAMDVAMAIIEDLVRAGAAPGADSTVHVTDPFGATVLSSAHIDDISVYSERAAARIEEAFDNVRWITASAITAAGSGLITDGGYTPDERSRNAAAQFRDRLGRFSKVGDIVSNEAGRSAQVMSYDPATGMAKIKYSDGTVQQINVKRLQRLGDGPADGSDVQQTAAAQKRARRAARSRITKAVMRTTLPLLSPDDIKQLLADYEADVAKRRRGLTAAALTPDNSDVPPVYLAVVDAIDNEAVVDLLALVPASPTSSAPQIYVRTAEGWTADPKMLLRIKSTSPPPLVHLDNKQVPDIMAQVDSYFKEKGAAPKPKKDAGLAAAAAAAASDSGKPGDQLALWGDDGTLLPPVLRGGGVPGVADTPEDFAAVRRLRRYWLRGPGALKIRWNTPGDYRRCVRHLRKYVGVRANGLCANYHHAATGMWTGDARHRKLYGGMRASGDREALMYVSLDPTTTNIVSTPVVAAVVAPTVDEVARAEVEKSAQHQPPILASGAPVLVQSAEGPVVLTVLPSSDIRGWSLQPAIARWDSSSGDITLLPDSTNSERG